MTAVKWLLIELTKSGLPPHKEIIKCFEEAKQIEKKQIENALNAGYCIANEDERYKHIQTTEQYYNETYNNVQQP
jgi:hypothetical protein